MKASILLKRANTDEYKIIQTARAAHKSQTTLMLVCKVTGLTRNTNYVLVGTLGGKEIYILITKCVCLIKTFLYVIENENSYLKTDSHQVLCQPQVNCREKKICKTDTRIKIKKKTQQRKIAKVEERTINQTETAK